MKVVTTRYDNHTISYLLDKDDHIIEVHPFSEDLKSLVGNIYVGRVMNVVKNIKAAFVNIGLEENAYLSLENTTKVYSPQMSVTPENIKQGDLILVQVIKDAHKTKAPRIVTEIALTGQYAVLTTNHSMIGLSSKIVYKHDREHLKKLFKQFLTKDYGFIVRTNCLDVEDEVIVTEIQSLVASYEKIMNQRQYAMPKQCLHQSVNGHFKLLRDLYHEAINQYVYDDSALYLEAKKYMESVLPKEVSKIKLYTDSFSLSALFNLEKQLERAVKEKVWLKSGASIIIQPTEALTVIDVNTEKSNLNKIASETILITNIEAAYEIARQIRLRNLSGIIIIDFIDMATDNHKERLCDLVASLCLQDRIKTNFIDITPLGLVEITRKKSEKTLLEKFNEVGIKIGAIS